jgi:alpha-aminoadipic semialdehyde synthase
MTNLSGNSIIGISRETKSKWERRCPLSPFDVRYLIQKHGLRIIVQPSSRRVYPDVSFSEAGAEINEDLSSCGTILAVKEVPLSFLLSDRTYLFFSHTIKAQPYNMALLDSLVEKRIRLIDYETITEEQYNEMVTHLHNIDLRNVVEMSDMTNLMENLACSGGSCEIV